MDLPKELLKATAPNRETFISGLKVLANKRELQARLLRMPLSIQEALLDFGEELIRCNEFHVEKRGEIITDGKHTHDPSRKEGAYVKSVPEFYNYAFDNEDVHQCFKKLTEATQEETIKNIEEY